MANKWRTTVSEANAVFVNYGVHPSDLASEALTRKWTGIDRSVLYSLITTLRATTTVTDPKADGQTYLGIWTVDSVDPVLDEGGNLAGSATIVQVLKKNVYSLATPDNVTIVRSRAYPTEQAENAWMYYERFKSEVTKKWHNILAANIETEYDKIRQIFLLTYFDADYCGLYSLIQNPSTFIYYTNTPSYFSGAWHIGAAEVISNPIIRECWYEQNSDGTYNLFRSLETTTSTAIMRRRSLQYAGMTLVQGSPMLDDTVLTIKGFNNLTEVVYKDARLRIGSDTYRVLANSMAVAGQVTVDVTPSVTSATETLCDDSPNQCQVFFEAL